MKINNNDLLLNYVAPSTMKRIREIGAKATERDFTMHVEKHQHVMSQIRLDNINVHDDIARVSGYFPKTEQFDPSSIECAKTIPNVLNTYDTSHVDANGILIEGLEIIDKEFKSLRLIEQFVAKRNSNAVSNSSDDYKSLLQDPVNEKLLSFVRPYLKRDAKAELPVNFDESISNTIVDLLSVEHYQTVCRIVQMSNISEQAVWLVSEHRMFVILGLQSFVMMSYASVNSGFVTGVMSKLESKLYTKCSTPNFKMLNHAVTYRYHYVAAAVLGASFTKYLAPSLISNLLSRFEGVKELKLHQKMAANPIIAAGLGGINFAATGFCLIKDAAYKGFFATQLHWIDGSKEALKKAISTYNIK